MNTGHWTHNLSLLLLRLTFGGLMVVNHGLGKVDKLMGSGTVKFADPLGIGPDLSMMFAAGAEAICGTLLALGLFTRLNALPLMITMAVAAFMVHGGDPLPDREPALMYLGAFTALFFLGGGSWSLQSLFMHWLPRNRVIGYLLS